MLLLVIGEVNNWPDLPAEPDVTGWELAFLLVLIFGFIIWGWRQIE